MLKYLCRLESPELGYREIYLAALRKKNLEFENLAQVYSEICLAALRTVKTGFERSITKLQKDLVSCDENEECGIL
ncbi:hypothetical protein NPIL_285861 [Nephila pilipes]|uniref:Uncharacterized protein n=1 Tax=Nephila pilipes TaxID=299642 RepID=A0A8X6NY28_NEPPI|nr:hypothetical protein NPIL_285861 [Nephila pilipes]